MKNFNKTLAIYAGPLSAIFVFIIMHYNSSHLIANRMAAITVWMAVWWILEAVPLAVTSLLPVFLFPLLNIMDAKTVAPLYMNPIIFLFIGGFIVSFAMERWNLHKRIALKIISLIGYKTERILFGFMLASYFLSMWMSNTATVMMMIPTTLAVLHALDDVIPEGNKKFSIGLLLAIAYGASIGGTATLIGTPPNMIFLSQYEKAFPMNPPVTFTTWFLFGIPLSLLFLICAYFLLKHFFCRFSIDAMEVHRIFEKERFALGKISYEEKIVLADFIILALLWFFRADIPIGNFKIPGWSNLLPNPKWADDGTTAILMATLLFLIPSRKEKGERIMNWETAKKLPFGIILLFGGGFALAEGFMKTGLSEMAGEGFGILENLPLIIAVLIVCTVMTFLTEVTSNTAITQLMLPLLIAASARLNIHPLMLMLPATFSASFAFMLPVGTPPNAIVFGSGRIRINEMARTGFWMNMIGIILTTALMFTLGRVVFGI